MTLDPRTLPGPLGRRLALGGLALAAALVACGPARAPSPPPAAPAPSRAAVLVHAQTSDEAFEWLWRQLADMPFFRQNHYTVGLPAHRYFQKLANDGLGGADKEEAHRLFTAEVYDETAFTAGRAVLERRIGELAPELDTFARWSSRWGFAAPPRYRVVLTLYGPGGSYDPETATITVLTTPEGAFKKEPIHNLVHEMVHVGIEAPIVKRFALTHQEKERLVDRVCVVAFGDLLPGYEVQPLGPPKLDAFIDRAALDDLPAAVARYRAEAPP